MELDDTWLCFLPLPLSLARRSISHGSCGVYNREQGPRFSFPFCGEHSLRPCACAGNGETLRCNCVWARCFAPESKTVSEYVCMYSDWMGLSRWWCNGKTAKSKVNKFITHSHSLCALVGCGPRSAEIELSVQKKKNERRMKKTGELDRRLLYCLCFSKFYWYVKSMP